MAGLAAVQAAKNMGAIVKAFDVRPAVKEQIESLGGEFLEVDLKVSQTEERGRGKEWMVGVEDRFGGGGGLNTCACQVVTVGKDFASALFYRCSINSCDCGTMGLGRVAEARFFKFTVSVKSSRVS